MSVAIKVVNAGNFRRARVAIHSGDVPVVIGPGMEPAGLIEHITHQQPISPQFGVKSNMQLAYDELKKK